MQDYLTLGHMEAISTLSTDNLVYYIPHHCVLKPDISTTKLGVVFDASSKCPVSKQFLNDVLLTGTKLQRDLVSILLRFVLSPVVFTSNIKKMYREIVISEEHKDFQRIMWRFSRADPIQDYRLKMVTFGASSSPYLAIRTLLNLAEDNKQSDPIAANILGEDVFVDVIVTGCDLGEEALKIQQELTDLLHKVCFELRKWARNDSRELSLLPLSALQF